MNFLNLTLVEFFAILIPVSAAVVALYLYDRSRRRQVVSTLRFFPQFSQAPVFTRRKKIQQPWSLILQLLSILLLLLAIAEPVFRRAVDRGRDHVLVLETSAWMNSAGPDRRAPLMELARRRALDYLAAVPRGDRVLVIRADGLATPATGFTSDRRELEEAVRLSQPGATALNLSAALELARSAQRLASTRPGEIAVIGSGRVMRTDLDRLAAVEPANLRTILIGAEPNDCGIRKLSARRVPASPLEWEVEAGAYNYGASDHRHTLRLMLAGIRVGSRALVLPAHSSAETTFRFRSTAPGRLEAILESRDDYAADNRISLELPGLAPLQVQVYTAQPARWQALLTASPFLAPEFLNPAQYAPGGAPHRLVILDGFTATAPDADSVAIPADRGAARLQIRRWNPAHPVAAGLSDKDVRLSRATVLKAAAADTVVAEAESGPVIVAREEGGHKRLLFGFHPVEEGTENHLAIPLLFANIVRWISPDLFRLAEVVASPPGLIEVQTPAGVGRDQIEVTSQEIRDLPYTLVDGRMRLFASRRGTVRITLPGQELVYSFNLPEAGEARWRPPAGARQGVPPPAPASPLGWPLWPWLAALGAAGLIVEWIWFGRRPVVAAPAAAAPQTTGLGLSEPAPRSPEEVRS
jgi:hypothetical protein